MRGRWRLAGVSLIVLFGLTSWVSAQDSPAPAGGAKEKKASEPAIEPVSGITAEEIMDRSAKAMWGDHYRALKSYRFTASMELLGMGMKGTIIMSAKAPHQSYASIEFPQLKQEEGYDGTTAWSSDSISGVRSKEEKELAMAKYTSDFYGDADWRTRYQKATLEGQQSSDGKKCYVLNLEVEGLDPVRQGVDAESFLPIWQETAQEGPQGTMMVHTSFSDFRSMEGDGLKGIQTPFKSTMKMGPQTVVMIIEKMECNIDLPDSTFTMPEAEDEDDAGAEAGDDDADEKGTGKGTAPGAKPAGSGGGGKEGGGCGGGKEKQGGGK